MLDEDAKKKLADLFYSNSVFMSGLSRWMNKAVELLPDVPTKELRLFYNNQTLTQMFLPRITSVSKTGVVRRPIINNVPFGRVYADSMFFKEDGFGLICFVDGFSKLGFVYYLPVGDSKSVSGGDGAEALFQFIKYHEKNYPQFPIGAIVHDAGSEFTEAFDRIFSKYLPDAKNTIAEIGGILKNPIAERFNYSLRLMIEKFRSTFNPTKITDKMINKIVENYNQLPSTSLKGLSPVQALENVEDALERIKSRRAMKTNFTTIENKFPVGAYVRTIRKEKKLSNPYAKTLRANWSEEVRKIDGFDKKKQRFVIGRKLYGDFELLRVDKKLLDDYDMFSKKMHDISTVSKDVVKESFETDSLVDKILDIYIKADAQGKKQLEKIAGYKVDVDPTTGKLTGGITTGSKSVYYFNQKINRKKDALKRVAEYLKIA